MLNVKKCMCWCLSIIELVDTVHCIHCQLLIFQYRDIAEEVYHILQKHRPLVKPMTFVGQSSTGKQSKGFSQKQQLKVSKLDVSQFCLQMLQVCSLILSVLLLVKFCTSMFLATDFCNELHVTCIRTHGCPIHE